MYSVLHWPFVNVFETEDPQIYDFPMDKYTLLCVFIFVSDILLNFVSAGGHLCLEVKKYNPRRMEGESSRWWNWTGEEHQLHY